MDGDANSGNRPSLLLLAEIGALPQFHEIVFSQRLAAVIPY